MPSRHVIVDGSNLATEGRSLPSLTQLDQAVREYLAENPADVVTVVVDASFGHRIDPSEVPMFEEAEAAGELVSPPAGAIGRGDAFLLRIAEKTGATVLSNDSFQEFHGEHSWLFDDGRLVGGKPVPGVGWIFLARAPVRGQRSRDVVKEAKRRKRADESAASVATIPTGRESGLDLAASKAKGRAKKVDRAIARATEEAVEPKGKGHRRRRVGGVPPAEAVNEPLAFITFIAAHPLGSEVVGTVLEFSSHGAFVSADGARCYLPLSAMGEPPPRRAREVLAKGEERRFVIQALDPQRRGIELALPGFARVAGGPTAETVEAEIHPQAEAEPKHRRREKADAAEAVALDGSGLAEAAPPSPIEVRSPPVHEPTADAPSPEADVALAPVPPARRAASRKVAAAAAANVDAVGQEASPAVPVAAKRPASKRAPAVKKAPAAKATPAKKATAAATPARARPAKMAGPVEDAGSAEATPDTVAGAKKAPARKTGVGVKATPAKATPAKATGRATPAKAAPARATPAKAATSPTPEKATPEASPAKATPAKRAAKATTRAAAAGATAAGPGPTAKEAPKKAAPMEKAASPEKAAPSAGGPRRTPRARRPVSDAPDGAAAPEP